MKNILIIEDDTALANGINLALENSELHVANVYNLKTAKDELQKKQYDLIILDVNLPDGNGLDFLKSIKKNQDIAVIILTANDMETDIVAGLEWGADDYMTKPFSLAVLRARVNTQLRRQTRPASLRMSIDHFEFDFNQMSYSKDGVPIELSKTEQKLLKILVVNKGITLLRTDLIDKIWTDGAEYVDENALSVTVKRLRNKLEEIPSQPKYIKTVYGIGYFWEVT